MSDNSIIPISEEQAKLGQQLVETGKSLGGYLADILGDLPKDLVGILGDQVKVYRAVRLDALWKKSKEYLQVNGAVEPESPGLNLVLPILEAAADENREELQDLWARLLAASLHPDRLKLVRLRFIGALKSLDPLDVRMILWLQNYEQAHPLSSSQGTIFGQRDTIAKELMVSTDEIEVSTANIILAGFAFRTASNVIVLTPFGREFLRAVEL